MNVIAVNNEFVIDIGAGMKKVITYGSFDLFHEGHYRLLERAKALGDYLIVGVTTEHYDEERGKLNVVDSLMDRIEHVRATGFADEIIVEDHIGQKIEDIQKYGVDIFTVGSDWTGKFEYIRDYCEVVYLERTKDISSTMLREKNFGIVKLGVIGSGRIAKRFVPEVKYVSGINAELVYNPHLESAQKFAIENELHTYTDNLEEFYAQCDAVYIATPHNTHYDYIKKSLLHGKHVLCEKPMVLKREEAVELFALAKEKGLVLMEAIKTAYTPGFKKLVSVAKSGRIGRICDVEACFTKLVPVSSKREFDPKENGGSFTELASYPLLAIIKTLGKNVKDVRFVSFCNDQGLDLYTKAYVTYEKAVATVKVGIGVKSEGNIVISGTNGYILGQSPWWLTREFEVCYENRENNEKYFTKFNGEGLSYEISELVSRIRNKNSITTTLDEEESILIAGIMEQYLRDKAEGRIVKVL